jgi:hypothetical protein
MRTMGRGMEATGQIGPHAHEEAGALYGRVEHLAQEEDQLLAIVAEQRTEEHRARLKQIREELDRVFHHLRERHERRTKDA